MKRKFCNVSPWMVRKPEDFVGTVVTSKQIRYDAEVGGTSTVLVSGEVIDVRYGSSTIEVLGKADRIPIVTWRYVIRYVDGFECEVDEEELRRILNISKRNEKDPYALLGSTVFKTVSQDGGQTADEIPGRVVEYLSDSISRYLIQYHDYSVDIVNEDELSFLWVENELRCLAIQSKATTNLLCRDDNLPAGLSSPAHIRGSTTMASRDMVLRLPDLYLSPPSSGNRLHHHDERAVVDGADEQDLASSNHDAWMELARMLATVPITQDDLELDHDLNREIYIISPQDIVNGNDGILLNILEYFPNTKLIEKKTVSSRWNELCTKALRAAPKKPFETTNELRMAVNKYLGWYESAISNEGHDIRGRNIGRHHPPRPAEVEWVINTYGPIRLWDVSKIKDFSSLFLFQRHFNEDISGWDVSNATTLFEMFKGAESFDQDLSLWDVSNVTEMRVMFHGAKAFNQNLATWNTSKVTDMCGMFFCASSFNGDISTWNVSNVRTIAFMFFAAREFNQDISLWDVSNALDMQHLFADAAKFDQDLSRWNTFRVQDMKFMFYGAISFKSPLFRNVQNVTNMERMFLNAESINDADHLYTLMDWDTRNAVRFKNMFAIDFGNGYVAPRIDAEQLSWFKLDMIYPVDFLRFASLEEYEL